MAINAGPKIVEDGLVFCVDAANKRSYPGAGTTWTDLTANKNNGTLTNGPTFDGANGGSIVFDATDEYVNVTVTKTANCTFSSWASYTASDPTYMLFNAGNHGAGPDLFFYDGRIFWNTWDGANNPLADIPTDANNGKFHNYVLVNDSSSTAKLYYDGDLLGTATYRSAASTTKLIIGSAGPGGTYYNWQGNIANFMLHNRLLTEKEIKQNYISTQGRFQ
jgi:hypothetical protein